MADRVDLSMIPVLGPWQKTEHHLRFSHASTRLGGFFGLPQNVFVHAVKIGLVAYEETGSFGKVVHPGQELVIVLENKNPIPISLTTAFMEVDFIANKPPAESASQAEPEEPEAGPNSIFHRFALLFGGGQARVGFRTRELVTLEEIWSCAADLERVVIMGTHFHGDSLWAWQGMVLGENTSVEITFTPKSASKGRAIVRLEKLEFPSSKVAP